MKILTSRFGEIEVPENAIFTFPEGILGFSDLRTFALLEGKTGGPFRWLQAGELPGLAFVLIDPSVVFPDYRVGVHPEDLAGIGLSEVSKGFVMVIVTMGAKPADMTANLQGPLVFNSEARQAKQLVLIDRTYTTRHRLFPEEKS